MRMSVIAEWVLSCMFGLGRVRGEELHKTISFFDKGGGGGESTKGTTNEFNEF